MSGASSSITRAPILRLPYDILYRVFRTTYGMEFNNGCMQHQTPKIVSHVCRSWRNQAIQSPTLWATILFCTGTRSAQHQHQRLWIERSRHTALSITICYPCNIKQMALILRLIRPHTGRWQSLTLLPNKLKDKSFRLLFDEVRHMHAPILRDLHIMCDIPSRRWRFKPFGGDIPSLVDLSIDHRWVNRDTVPTLFGHLTRLSVGHVHHESRPSNCLSALHLLAMLAQTIEHFSMDDCHCSLSEDLEAPSLPILLPRLHSLILPDRHAGSSPTPWVLHLYANILAPNMSQHNFEAQTLLRLLNYNKFPFPALLKIFITFVDGGEDDEHDTTTVAAVLSQLPQLESLRISCSYFFDHQILVSLGKNLRKFSIEGSPLAFRSSGWRKTIEARRHYAAAKGRIDSLSVLNLGYAQLPKEEVLWLKGNMRKFSAYPYPYY